MLTLAKNNAKPILIVLLAVIVAFAMFPAATTAIIIVEQLPVGNDARPALSFTTTALILMAGIGAILTGAWLIAKRYQEKDV